MKKLKIFIMAGLMLAVLSCKERDPIVDDPNPDPNPEPNMFIANGDGFTDRKFLLDQTSEQIAYYTVGSNITTVSSVGQNDSFEVIFNADFTGNNTKTASFSVSNSVSLNINSPTISRDYSPKQGTITITKYGAVGEKIEGTFSGLFERTGMIGRDLTVSNGKFSIVRKPDE